MIRPLVAVRSGPRVTLPLAVVMLCAIGGPVVAADGTNGHLANVRQWTTSGGLAFVRDSSLRLFLTNERACYDAKWKPSRVSAQVFSYASTTMERDDSPPALPASKSNWQPVQMIAIGESDRLIGTALSRVAPTNIGRGFYIQLSSGDGFLFRDADGNARLSRFQDRPPGIVVERRLGRQEITSALIESVDQDLRAAYPGRTRFLAALSTSVAELLYLDLETKESVVMFVPRPGRDPNRPAIGGNLKTLASFALVDNGWSFLKNPVSSATRTLHQGLQWSSTIIEPKLLPRVSDIPPVSNAPAMDLEQWERWLDRRIGMRRERGAVRLLIDGEKFFPHFDRRVAEARSNINIHVCIFDRDDVAIHFADMLKERARSLEVKVVYDRLNSRGAGGTPPATPMPEDFVPPKAIGTYLRKDSSIQVRPQLNPGFSCDHSKVFLIDRKYAYLGGMNFGREYRYEWHDLMAEIEGPVVDSLQEKFDRKWAQTGVWGDLALAGSVLNGTKHRTATEPPDAIELRRLYTKTFSRQIRKAELEAINRARNHILLENSYLYSNDMIIALVRARLRGVDVRVIMPGENDFGSGHSSNLVTANYLRQHGVRVYFYPGMSHVKALLVDGWVCFGSANFDALSLRLNRECNLASSDPGFAATFRREVFETDMAKSRELTSDTAVDFRDHLLDALLTPL